VIDVRLATRLKRAGLAWHPEPGDRFAIPQPDLLGQVFTLSDMTIEVHQRRGGAILGFNGTTEWALDSVQAADVVWLPAEHQLRELIGPAFRGLQVVGGGFGGDGAPVDGPDAGGFGGDEAPVDGPDAGGELPGLRAADGVPVSGDLQVLADIPGSGVRAFRAAVAEDAYALALLALIRRATD
jgi:hypothetical protein